jgi:hypothetical protein
MGVAAVVGFLLIFSFLIMAAAQYQTTVIPAQEENKEINHSREVRGQMNGIQSAIRGSANSDELRTQEVQLGTQYEFQMIFGIIPAIHQPDPSGELEYTAADGPNETIVIDGAEGQRGASEYWSGNTIGYVNDDSGWLTYEPNYNHYQDAPTTVYENGLIYDEYPDDDGDDIPERVFRSDQNLVTNRNITITSLGGDVDVQGVTSRTLEAHPVSAPRTRIAAEAPNGLTIVIPTKLTADEWRTLLEEQNELTPDGYVTNVSNVGSATDDQDAVSISFVGNETYTLGLARVFVTTRLSETAIPATSREYIAWNEDNVIIRERSKARIDAQVRDKYNNPIPGIDIEAIARDSSGQCIGNFDSASGPGSECSTSVDQPGLQTSANEGETTFIYEAPEVSEDTQIDITIRFEN